MPPAVLAFACYSIWSICIAAGVYGCFKLCTISADRAIVKRSPGLYIELHDISHSEDVK